MKRGQALSSLSQVPGNIMVEKRYVEMWTIQIETPS